MSKDELREQLALQAETFTKRGNEIVTYAAQRRPERKPWRKRETPMDRVFQEELERLNQDAEPS